VKFELRDYCLGATYSDTTFLIDDESTLIGFDYSPGSLVLAKTILTPSTTFTVEYPTYQKYDGTDFGCGPQGIDMKYLTVNTDVDEWEEIV